MAEPKSTKDPQELLRCGDWWLDTRERRLLRTPEDNKGVKLGRSHKVYPLLKLLLENEGRVVLFDEMWDTVWQQDYKNRTERDRELARESDRATMIETVRRLKIRMADCSGVGIEPIEGVGYKLVSGYRLAKDVKTQPDPPPSQSADHGDVGSRASGSKKNSVWLGRAAFFLALVCIVLVLVLHDRAYPYASIATSLEPSSAILRAQALLHRYDSRLSEGLAAKYDVPADGRFRTLLASRGWIAAREQFARQCKWNVDGRTVAVYDTSFQKDNTSLSNISQGPSHLSFDRFGQLLSIEIAKHNEIQVRSPGDPEPPPLTTSEMISVAARYAGELFDVNAFSLRPINLGFNPATRSYELMPFRPAPDLVWSGGTRVRWLIHDEKQDVDRPIAVGIRDDKGLSFASQLPDVETAEEDRSSWFGLRTMAFLAFLVIGSIITAIWQRAILRLRISTLVIASILTIIAMAVTYDWSIQQGESLRLREAAKSFQAGEFFGEFASALPFVYFILFAATFHLKSLRPPQKQHDLSSGSHLSSAPLKSMKEGFFYAFLFLLLEVCLAMACRRWWPHLYPSNFWVLMDGQNLGMILSALLPLLAAAALTAGMAMVMNTVRVFGGNTMAQVIVSSIAGVLFNMTVPGSQQPSPPAQYIWAATQGAIFALLLKRDFMALGTFIVVASSFLIGIPVVQTFGSASDMSWLAFLFPLTLTVGLLLRFLAKRTLDRDMLIRG
jgi:DNA-binding winged helix-turn-helix (wHTH) protein